MVGELVTDGARHLRLEQLGVAAEVAQQRVLEDHDPVVKVVLRDRVALVEPIRAVATAAVGDDDRDVLERAVELERQVIDRGANERLEVLII